MVPAPSSVPPADDRGLATERVIEVDPTPVPDATEAVETESVGSQTAASEAAPEASEATSEETDASETVEVVGEVFDPAEVAPIVPAAETLINSAMGLQNAVLRACVLRDADGVLEADLADTAAAAARIKTMAFGSPFGATIGERLMTEASDTLGSRSTLNGIMQGVIMQPGTLAELQQVDRALMGLPALAVLLRSGAPEADTERPCQMAAIIAANIVESALAFKATWENEALRDPQWTSNPPELADRLRVRDIIEAGIITMDKLDFDVARYIEQRSRNNALPFASASLMRSYMLAVIDALADHAEWLASLLPPEDEADGPRSVLAQIDSTLEAASASLAMGGDIDPSPFGRLRRLYFTDLPAAFGFASEAFSTPIGAFATD